MTSLNEQFQKLPSLHLQATRTCDVLIVGSGIAGCFAALEAARTGASVLLASSGPICSGASFSRSTWGLGLIGPEDDQDAADLEQTILKVGEGVANEHLVHTLVTNISPAIKELEELGVSLRKPEHENEREYIPCFDHKHRSWYGLERTPLSQALTSQFSLLNIEQLPYARIIKLIESDGSVCGAVFSHQRSLKFVSAKAVVLATGGYTDLYEDNFGQGESTGYAHALAQQVGAELVNMEFMQMMYGSVDPIPGIIYNEKVFRCTRFTDARGRTMISEKARSLLDMRSGYGPFTSSLPSALVDIELNDYARKKKAIYASLDEKELERPSELVRSFLSWQQRQYGLLPTDRVELAMFAHAANGGIKIDCEAWTGVPGLYAAGEVTGGMHGANRIGGLSSANALVFGRIAGASAARAAIDSKRRKGPSEVDIAACSLANIDDLYAPLRKRMSTHVMVVRKQKDLERTLAWIDKSLRTAQVVPATKIHKIGQAHCMIAELQTARAIVAAAFERTESLGAHYRAD